MRKQTASTVKQLMFLMKKSTLLLLTFFLFVFNSQSQKKVASYPFEFSKALLARSDFDSYFLQDNSSQQFMLILKDNKKADYLLYNNNLKLASHYSPEDGLESTVFNFDYIEYLGGTANNGKFNFVYKVIDKKLIGSNTFYQIETIDVVNKKISNRQLFEIPKDEKFITSFGDYGQYLTITAKNNTQELNFYAMNIKGESSVKSIKINIPESSKKKNLSEYLEGIKLFKETDEPGIESATEKVKLFHGPNKIDIVVNEKDDPTQVISINTKDFTASQKSIDHSTLTKDEKGKSYINSFLFQNNIYALVLNKKNIRIAIYNAETAQLLKTHEINDATDLNTLAEVPLIEERRGKRTGEKEIDNIKKLIKLLDKGSEAIMLNKSSKGNLVITIGTYDLIPISSGGAPPTKVTSMSFTPLPGANNTKSGNVYTVTREIPGRPSFTSYSANFYMSTHFKLMIDPTTLNFVKGQAPSSTNDQIKDYMIDVSKKARAINQFSVNGKQYFGYYNQDEKEYIIEEIIIRK